MARKKTKTSTRSKAPSRSKVQARKKPRPKKKASSKSPAKGLQEIIILPVRNMILFPGVALPLMIGRERSIRAIQAAMQQGQSVGLLLQRDGDLEVPTTKDLHRVGTLAEILRYWPLSEDRHNAICQANDRFEVVEFLQEEPFIVARIRIVPTKERITKPIAARFRALKDRAREVLELASGAPEDLAEAVEGIESPTQLADLVATFMDAPAAAKQDLLETFDLKERLDKLMRILGDLEEVLRLSNKIRQDTRGSLDQAQREYFLREQLRAIRRELGDDMDQDSDLDDLRVRALALPMPEKVREAVSRDLRRLERTPEQSAEHPMLRSWVETVLELPWGRTGGAKVDLRRAERILNEDHHGLEKVKQRILEALAVRKLSKTGSGTILCLLGPPGVGKTSLGRSVARALQRPFARIALGGMHDESEIRGHRRTYVGAMPGRIVSAMKEAGSMDPVFLLDEVDKLGRGFHGDPSAALLEVLDPAQNKSFTDSYLGLPFDLSGVFFLATANLLDTVPAALRDRLEVIELPGYTANEKLEIAKAHLLPRQLERAGLTTSQLKIRVGALREVIRFHTREAGVRELERGIASICRHAAFGVAKGRKRKALIVDADGVTNILGPREHEHDVRERTATSGVATGLAWTPTGGEILFIEAAHMPGKGELILTGQLGDVMQESARIAQTLVRARALDLGLDANPFKNKDLHLHLPGGAVPKDGPSAGVGIYAAIVSLLSNRRVRADVAMTGEVSLRGRVLPVGGVKEKVLGALAAGIRTILLPERNMDDLRDVPDEARERLTFVPLKDVGDVLEHALMGRAD